MGLAIPLDVLVGIVGTGLAGVAAFTWAAGWARPARLESPEQAARRFALDYPEDTVHHAVLTDDGAAAWLQLSSGHAVVLAVGQDFAVRKLPAGALQAIAHTAHGVRLHLHDPGLPRVTLAWRSPHTRSQAHAAFAPLVA